MTESMGQGLGSFAETNRAGHVPSPTLHLIFTRRVALPYEFTLNVASFQFPLYLDVTPNNPSEHIHRMNAETESHESECEN